MDSVSIKYSCFSVKISSEFDVLCALTLCKVIGRGGGQISRLQAETGCKIQMAPDSPGLLERSCTLTGNAQSITYVFSYNYLLSFLKLTDIHKSKSRLAKELIQNIVQNKVSVEGTGGAKIEGLNISSPPSQPAFTQVEKNE